MVESPTPPGEAPLDTDYTRDQPISDTLAQALDLALGARAPTAGDVFVAESVEDVCALIAAADGFGGHVRLGPPRTGQLGLDLSRLDAIQHPDTASGLVTVECGATPLAIEAALAAEGLTLGRGWFSRPDGPVGAALAAGEGAPLVLSLSAVLADGTRFHTPSAPRRATGPDPVALLVGARGRTGIIVGATLRAVSAPAPTDEWVAVRGNAARLVEALRLMHRAGLSTPATLRKGARGQAVVTLRVPSARAGEARAALQGAGTTRPADLEPPPPGRPVRLGWTRLLELAAGQGGRGTFMGPTDLHGAWVRLPSRTAGETPLLRALARRVDPHSTLVTEGAA